MDSREERERLKQQYKEHYRKIRDTKERLRKAQQKGKIADALGSLDNSELFDAVDDFIISVKDKVSSVEARLEVALETLMADPETGGLSEEDRETVRKQKAKETLKQVKAEMGMLYNEIEEQASELKVEKTIGQKEPSKEGSESENEPQSEQG